MRKFRLDDVIAYERAALEFRSSTSEVRCPYLQLALQAYPIARRTSCIVPCLHSACVEIDRLPIITIVQALLTGLTFLKRPVR